MGRGEGRAGLFDDVLQHGGQQRVFGAQFVVVVGGCPFHVGQHQPVVADARAQHMEATLAAQAQYQHAVGAHVEILDACFHAVRGRHRRRPHFIAVQNQADAETGVLPAALAQHVQVAAFKYPQAQRGAR